MKSTTSNCSSRRPTSYTRQLPQLDVDARDLGREPRLGQVALVAVDADDAVGAAALHLDRVKAGVAADVEHRLPAQVLRDGVREPLPLECAGSRPGSDPARCATPPRSMLWNHAAEVADSFANLLRWTAAIRAPLLFVRSPCMRSKDAQGFAVAVQRADVDVRFARADRPRAASPFEVTR